MKIISLVAAFAFFVYGCLPSYAAAPFAPENTSYAELGQTAGFLAGQHAGLEKIKTEFPELAPSAQIAEAGFEVSFGKAEKSVTNEIKNLMKDKYAEYEQNLKSQIRDNQNKQILSQDTAANFISEVSARAKGDIPSPILETLLTYQYKDNPSEEFSRKYIHTFSTKNHAKAKGTNLTFSYPASWKAAEGNRPNIIQKFVSENGHGLEMFLVMVKDMPLPQGHIMTPQELDEFFIEKELKECCPRILISFLPNRSYSIILKLAYCSSTKQFSAWILKRNSAHKCI